MTGKSILTTPLPETVVLADGTELAIRTDFRVGILFSAIRNDPMVSPASKRHLALRLYYESLPEKADPDELFHAAMCFYSRASEKGTEEDCPHT